MNCIVDFYEFVIFGFISLLSLSVLIHLLVISIKQKLYQTLNQKYLLTTAIVLFSLSFSGISIAIIQRAFMCE